MSSPSKRREMDLMKLMMSDYKVEMINDGMQEFYVDFTGPTDGNMLNFTHTVPQTHIPSQNWSWTPWSFGAPLVRKKNAPEATQKFGLLPQLSLLGSLSALESRPGSLSKRLPDELEEGEIAVSGDSQMDLQQSGRWILQPKLKKKRTMRTRPRPTLDRLEDRTCSEKSSLWRWGSSQLAYPIGQSKRHKLINEVETESVPPLPKLHSRVSASADEEVRVRGPMSKFQKESRLASSSSVRELNQPLEAPSFTHPGELVICKKKRNARDKSVVKLRTAGPVSPPSVGRNVRGGLGPGSIPVPRDAKFSQQSTQQNRLAYQPPSQHTDGGGGGGGGNLGWAKPVKRMRTDTGKRRPRHYGSFRI